jgi:hypothetical protein
MKEIRREEWDVEVERKLEEGNQSLDNKINGI